jgi:cobalt-zinc-cadmium efflux system membrane fusion protein
MWRVKTVSPTTDASAGMNLLRNKQALFILGGILVVGAGLAAFSSPSVRQHLEDFFEKKAHAGPVAQAKPEPAALLSRDNTATGVKDFGLKLQQKAIDALELNPKKAVLADKDLPLPPMIGSLNYDNDRLFTIRPRFQGEVVKMKEIDCDLETSHDPQSPKKKRPLRFGDHVEQGEVLTELWCRDLGEKKAALVDALCAQRLSKETLERSQDLFNKGALPLAALKQAERQLQADTGAVLTAERTLRIWKLTDKEIDTVKKEAQDIMDLKKVRDPKEEQNWARSDVQVPFLLNDPRKKLVVVEKNINYGEMVDPGRDTPLFRLADLTRLQIWVHPPEEYLTVLRERLKEGPGRLQWEVRFQSDPPNTPPRILDVAMISPSLQPDQHTPMLIGYLDNPEGKYLIGQFVTAIIRVPPPVDDNKKPAAVEIDTAAINNVKGQNFVFVQNPATPDECRAARRLRWSAGS